MVRFNFVLILSMLWSFIAWSSDVVPGEYLVKMRGKPSSANSAAFLGKISQKANLKASFGKLNMHHLALKPGEDAGAFLSEVMNDPDVEYVEPNFVIRLVAPVPEADQHVYSIDEARMMSVEKFSAGSYSQSGANTKVSQAWGQMSASASDVPVVAVIDTGIDYNHQIFNNSNALWRNPGEVANDGVDNDGNGFIDDTFGWNFYANNRLPYDDDPHSHGTHAAGIVLGVSMDILANPIGQAKIKIMPLKFLSGDGSGSTSSAVQAIYYAVNNGASVINNSWGGSGYSQSLHDALTYAYNHHVFIASASGNYASDNDAAPLYPASYPVPSQVAVSATNDWDSLASFSNYGRYSVHMSAPGVSIYSTMRSNGFGYLSGTSMATPFVAGLAAVMLREAPQLTGYQIANLMVNSGQNFSALLAKTISGNRVDGLNSVMASKGQVSAMATQPAYSPVNGAGRGLASDTSTAGGCGLVGLMARGGPPKGGPGQNWALVVGLSLLPLIVWQVLRRRQPVGANRRMHERFLMKSDIKLNVGGRELVGHMNTISTGGLSFQADAMLERGGTVTLQIKSPDGGEQIQVEGKIVWNEANKSYGVQFEGAKQGALSAIQKWTSNLVKAN